MTRDDVIRMAIRAGFDEWEIGVSGKARSALMERRLAKLERFAELVAARDKDDAERYRWLRINRLWLKANLPVFAAQEFDAAIDAARAKEQTS